MECFYYPSNKEKLPIQIKGGRPAGPTHLLPAMGLIEKGQERLTKSGVNREARKSTSGTLFQLVERLLEIRLLDQLDVLSCDS